MSFVKHRGKTKFMNFKNLDTTNALRDGGLVQLDDSSNLEPVRNDSTDRPIGVCRLNVALTDSTNNGGLGIPVEVAVENGVEWLIDVDSDAGAADSDVGRFCAVDTTGGNSVLAGDSAGMRADVSDTAIRQIFITGRLSATRIIGVIAKTAFNGGVVSDTATGA